MNILYLAHRIPFPPDKGDKIRSFRQLDHLARRHNIWCACFVDDPGDFAHLPALEARCVGLVGIPLRRTPALLRGVAGLVRGSTVTESFYGNSGMRRALREWSSQVSFDAVVAFSSSMAPYAMEIDSPRRVLDLCDLDSLKWTDYAELARGPSRWLYRTEGRRLAEQERVWLESFDATVLITEAEAAPLRNWGTSEKLHVIGNGVILPDASTLSPSPNGIWDDSRDAVQETGTDSDIHNTPIPTVGFVGVMNYRPNIDAVTWFVQEVWPVVREASPEAVFRIVGRSPTRRVRELATVPGVEVAGGVPDINTELRQFDISVAPMRIARGLQNKVLEAMAAGKPVVLTSKAAEGIAAEQGREYLVADSAEEIASATIKLISDVAMRKQIGVAARRYVAVNHCWAEVLSHFELVATGVLERSVTREHAAVLPTLAVADELEMSTP